jgi:hypothetical protein
MLLEDGDPTIESEFVGIQTDQRPAAGASWRFRLSGDVPVSTVT